MNRPRFRLAPLAGFLGCRKVLTAACDGSLLDALCAHYLAVAREDWLERFGRGHVFGADGAPLAPDARFRAPCEVHYYRPFSETPLPVHETVLHVDADLVVVDKPHFLPVHPAGKYLRETLVERVRAHFEEPGLSPLHRLDRATAGLVLFSRNPATRGAWQALFRERAIDKRYEALAPPLPALHFPFDHACRLQRHADGFRSEIVAGEANAFTRIDVIERGARFWRYALQPATGALHQLRVQMAALGAPIVHDDWYPVAQPPGADDYDRPLQLLAQSLRCVDPVTGEAREFRSGLRLQKLE